MGAETLKLSFTKFFHFQEQIDRPKVLPDQSMRCQGSWHFERELVLR
jgi:hypothetical protein